MCVFLISPVPIAEPLTSELIDTPVFYNLAPRPIKYRVSVPIPSYNTDVSGLHVVVILGKAVGWHFTRNGVFPPTLPYSSNTL